MPQHLYRPTHGHSQNWYVRLVPPQGVQHLTGPKEFRKSTGTADLKRAKTIGSQLIAQKRADWDKLLASSKQADGTVESQLTESLIELVCAKRLYHWMHLDDLGRIDGFGMTDEALSRLTELCQTTDQSMRSVLARGKQSDRWLSTVEVLDFWCDQISYKFSHADPLFPKLIREFARADIEGSGRIIKRNKGESADTPPVPSDRAVTLSVLTEVYRTHKQLDAGTKHVGTSVNMWTSFIDFCGDVPLDNIKASHLYEFMTTRMHAPSKPWSMKYTQGPVKRTLREVFAIARTMGLMTGSNPVDDLDIMPRLSREEEATRKKPRHPFTDTQLSTIYSSAWYNPISDKWKGKMRSDLGARYWVPLICMLHGNRVTEVLQLVASDISNLGGVPTIQFQAELEGEQTAMREAGVSRSLKNEATKRTVPVHPKLLQLGFAEFVEAQRAADGKHCMLFPSSLPKPGGKNPMIGRAYEEAFLRFVRDALKFGSGFGNHSFRHQLEDRIRDAQTQGNIWPPGLAQAYTGRKRLRSADVGLIAVEGSESGYGKGHTAVRQLPFINKLDFSRVKFPLPFTEWREMGGGLETPSS